MKTQPLPPVMDLKKPALAGFFRLALLLLLLKKAGLRLLLLLKEAGLCLLLPDILAVASRTLRLDRSVLRGLWDGWDRSLRPWVTVEGVIENSLGMSFLLLSHLPSFLRCMGCRRHRCRWWRRIGSPLGFRLGRTLPDLYLLCLFSRSLCWRLRGNLTLQLVTGDYSFGILRGVGGLICGRGFFREAERLVGKSEFQT